MGDTQPKQPQTKTEGGSSRFVGPPALVAHVEGDAANTIALYPVHLEYLRVRVLFHRVPVPGLEVTFRTVDGAEVRTKLITDEHGIAMADRLVPPGSYVCELPHQEPALVSTVSDAGSAFPVVLPVGRPYADLRERLELDSPKRK
jgi:hypothetical protein